MNTKLLQSTIQEWRSLKGTARRSFNVSAKVADALDWDQEHTALQDVKLDRISMVGSKALIRTQPAALFLTPSKSSNTDSLSHAALYAYHAAVRWGMVATDEGCTIYNSHWLLGEAWFSLPLIPWAQIGRSADVLSAFNPDGIISKDLDKAVRKRREPDKFLHAVDDALVERLDFWRTQALRYSERFDGMDEQLQTLFAQFFVLRTVEDKGLSPAVPSLGHFLTSKIPARTLSQTIKTAFQTIGSDLFSQDASKGIPEPIVEGIIRDLYTPHHLPKPAHYQFDWVSNDVLGSAYEKYLATIHSPAPPPVQQSLFEQPIRDLDSTSVRKQGGVYYTPSYLVEYLVERTLDRFYATHKSNEIPRVIDTSCGSGSFLVAAFDSLLRRLKAANPRKNWAREIISQGRICGVDIDNRAVTLARLALWIRFAQEPSPFPLPDLHDSVRKGDALNDATWKRTVKDFDLVIGNPPYVTLPISSVTDLSKFDSARGRYDYSYLFIEQGLRLLKPSGQIAMVIPNRLFKNLHASPIRNVMTAQSKILSVVDFGSLEVFEGTSAYIGTFIAQKLEQDENPERKLRAVLVKDLGNPRYLGNQLLVLDTSATDLDAKEYSSFEASYSTGGAPWLLLSKKDIKQRVHREQSSVRLDSIAAVVQGIKTGANDIFILEVLDDDGADLVKAQNAYGDIEVLERGILRSCILGPDLHKYEQVSSHRLLIYPYHEGATIPERILKSNFPNVNRYLNRFRSVLESRAGISAWYDLTRARDLNWLTSPKLLIRDLAPSPNFSIDPTGEIFNIGGSAIIPEPNVSLLSLHAYLNSGIVRSFLQPTAPSFRGGYQKYEPQHLTSIRVPNCLLTSDDLIRFLEEKVKLIMLAIGRGSDVAKLVEEIDNRLEKEIDG